MHCKNGKPYITENKKSLQEPPPPSKKNFCFLTKHGDLRSKREMNCNLLLL